MREMYPIRIDPYKDGDWIGFVGRYEGIPVEVYHTDELELMKDLIDAKEEYYATLEKERKEKENQVKKDVIAFTWDVDEENKNFDKEVANFLQEELGMNVQYETHYFSKEYGFKDEYQKECLFARTFFTTEINKYFNGAIDQRKVRRLLEKSEYALVIKKFVGLVL